MGNLNLFEMSEEDKQEAPPQMLGDSDEDSQSEEKKS